MSQLRDLGTLSTTVLKAARVEYWNFAKLIMPSPVGTLRFTQRPTGFTGDIDGSSQTWTPLYFTIPSIDEGRDDPLSVSAIEFPNMDNTFGDYCLTYGLRDRELHIYMGFFNADTGAFLDAFERFAGRTDEAEISDVCKVVLRSNVIPWTKVVPPFLIGPRCINPFKDPMSCQYAGAATVCYKSRKDCETLSNTLNFNGFDLLPPPGTIIKLGTR